MATNFATFHPEPIEKAMESDVQRFLDEIVGPVVGPKVVGKSPQEGPKVSRMAEIRTVGEQFILLNTHFQ